MNAPYGGKTYYLKTKFKGIDFSIGKVLNYGDTRLLYHRDNKGTQPLDDCPSPMDVVLIQYGQGELAGRLSHDSEQDVRDRFSEFWFLAYADDPRDRELYTILLSQLSKLQGQDRGGRFRVWPPYSMWQGPLRLPADFPDYRVPQEFNVFLPESGHDPSDVTLI